MSDINEYIFLLREKNNILNNIFEYTKNKVFEKNEDEIERIVYYLDNRQKMYDNLLIIDSKIKENKEFSNIKNKEIDDIIKKNDMLINNVLELDEKNKLIIESILMLLKKNIRTVKSMSKFNKSYLGTYENVIKGSTFDSSR